MKKEDIPDRVWKLFEQSDRWTKRAYARVGTRGDPIATSCDGASCFCAAGGLRLVYGEAGLAPFHANVVEATRRLQKAIIARFPQFDYPGDFLTTVIAWNDSDERTHEEVVAMCKEADV